MSYNINFRTVMTGAGLDSLDKTVTITADGKDQRDVSIPVATDTEVSVAFTQASLKGYYIVSDKDLTLETNATDHSGGNSIDMTAGVPLVWYTGCGYASIFTHDVTKFYMTNGGTAAATLSIMIAKDATP